MWVVTIDEKKVSLDDLTPAEFQSVADRHQMSWLVLYNNPATNIDAYYDLLVTCAQHAGAEPPERPDTMRDAKDLLDLITLEEQDDRPKAGTTPESPTTEDVPETT